MQAKQPAKIAKSAPVMALGNAAVYITYSKGHAENINNTLSPDPTQIAQLAQLIQRGHEMDG